MSAFVIVRLIPDQGECFWMGADLTGDWWNGRENHAAVFSTAAEAETQRGLLRKRWRDPLEVRPTGAQP